MMIKTFVETDYKELEDLILKTYGIEYNIAAYEEVKNYTSITKTVCAKSLDKGDLSDLDAFKSGEFRFYILGTLLDDMCRLKVIEPGEYIVGIYW